MNNYPQQAGIFAGPQAATALSGSGETRAIPSLVNDLLAQTVSLEHNVDHLVARLSAVLLPTPPANPKPDQGRPNASTQLGEALHSINDRLRVLNTLVADLEKRAQL
jgi:hypothetical protein